MIGNIDEDIVKLLHDSNRKSQMMPKGFKQVPWDESPCIPRYGCIPQGFLHQNNSMLKGVTH